jgi:hypothetical protein
MMDGYVNFQQAQFKQQDMLAQAEQRRLEEIALKAAPAQSPSFLNRLLRGLRPAVMAAPQPEYASLIPAEQPAG